MDSTKLAHQLIHIKSEKEHRFQSLGFMTEFAEQINDCPLRKFKQV